MVILYVDDTCCLKDDHCTKKHLSISIHPCSVIFGMDLSVSVGVCEVQFREPDVFKGQHKGIDAAV